MPVGFKWFVGGLLDGSLGFGGEESAGASFLRRDGSVWTTDKDGLLLDLLAAEITAVPGRTRGSTSRSWPRDVRDALLPAASTRRPRARRRRPSGSCRRMR